MISSLLLADVNGFINLSPAIEALGWTLLHFVWQGAVLGLGLAGFLGIWRQASPQVRYLAGCSALALMFLGALATFAWQMAALKRHVIEEPIAEPLVAVLPHVAASSENIVIRKPADVVAARSNSNVQNAIEDHRLAQFLPSIPLSIEARQSPVSSVSVPTAPAPQWPALLRPWLSWIVGLWALGAGVLVLRLAAGWGVILRLRARGERPKDPAWSARLDRLRVRLGVSSPVRLLSSASATVPMVIGWIRPVVLVPAGLLTGLSASQLEAIFAHELAHIRRHDFLVNLLQNVVETFFFYHPAVWWVSRHIRIEREHCCDDLAAAVCGSALDYARALTALAELRQTSGALGLAATGGSLVGRIARLAGISSPGPRAGWPFPVLVLVSGAAIAVFAANGASRRSEAENAVAPERKPSANAVCGRVLDPAGKPVADATVWLAASDGKWLAFDGLPIIAKGRSTHDGRFEFPLDKATLAQLATRERAGFEVWVRQPGLALAYHLERGGVPDHPLEIRMRPQERLSVRILNPDGSPCSNAIVAPTSGHYGEDRSVSIPEAVWNNLKVFSAADGRVALLGMGADEITELRIETPDTGVQCCDFPNWEWPDSEPADIVLRKTGSLKGRLVLPAGHKADLSRAQLHVKTNSGQARPGDTSWREHVAIRPDRDGRFEVSKIAEGTVFQIVVEVPDDFDCRPDPFGWLADRAGHKLVITPGRTAEVEIPLWQGVRVTGLVRDAQTKEPLPQVKVYLKNKNESVGKWTDEKGRFAAWIRPESSYQIQIELPERYVRCTAASSKPVVVHSGIRERELEPIELSRGRALDGVVVDPSGRPFAGIRIAARWRVPGSAPENKYAGDSTTQSWATADSQGRFRFDDLAVDVETTLTAVRAEIELAEPLPVDPKTDKPVQLQTARSDFAAISGRVIDRVGAPVSGAEIVVQWLRSKEIVDALRLHTDAAGRFETPAYFPKEFEYRLKVRSRCRDAATSPPRALAESTERFPDLVIDRPDPVELSKLAGGEVVAIVNGQPIFAKEIFERAYPEPLNNGGLSLLVANQNFASGRVTEAELRSLQDVAIRKYLKDYIRTRLLARALTSKLEKEQLDKIEEAIGKMFDEYVDKLKKDLKVRGRFEVEQKLRQQGTSLSSLKAEFRYRLLADEYLRSKRKEFHVSREATEAYYQRHLQDYSEPERVRWQLLEIRFDQHGGREKALALAEKLAAEAKRGEDFTTLVRTYSDGPRAEAGGKFSWTKPDDPQEQEIADAIHKIETGDIKPAFSEPVWSAVKLVLLGTPLKERDVVVDGAERALWQERVEKHLGKHFDRKYFDNGGKQPWTNPANLTDSTISAALRQLAPGEISRVLAGSESYRILRLIERRPAGRKPFDEVEPSIRQKVEDQQQDQLLFDLYDRATIESPYFPEHQTHSARRVSAGAPQVDSSGEYLFPTIVSPRAFKIERRIDFPEEAPHRNCA